ncbi:hypothetical protein GCM10010365_20560 [Streptomyces poonensis]|uniref:Uncharacterized protein n=1 Tax=Streptomyces poonensis TaxID=68255 RepID=A0A918PF01_9ACTN|nr:hypothetical protein GCM10010365_20560 [Streptomyces poonensis]GLJ90330.1 hypothetical protein GCM10017589_29330 [Streptomyces poonensis]
MPLQDLPPACGASHDSTIAEKLSYRSDTAPGRSFVGGSKGPGRPGWAETLSLFDGSCSLGRPGLVVSHDVVQVGMVLVQPLARGEPSCDGHRDPAKALDQRTHTTALDQSALLELLEALKAADAGDVVRQALCRRCCRR